MSKNDLFQQAKQFIPGGVNSPVRAFSNVNSAPIFMERGNGAYLYDINGTAYIDYINSWGPLILGHAHSEVLSALNTQIKLGVTFGTVTSQETELAKLITELVPSIEQIRLVNSGTEATMSAIRLARAYTQKDKIIKFAGCYHGHADSLLVEAGSGALTHGVPSSPGVPTQCSELTLIAEYNNIESVDKIIKNYPGEIAAIIIEPVAGNMNCVPGNSEFLSALRTLCDEHKILLIFDEVMSGFRVALGGAQELYDIKPDLTTLGKVIGGGLPVGAFGGRREIMSMLAPIGPVYQAGTLSGNPLAVAAGLATLKLIKKSGTYEKLTEYTAALLAGFKELASKHGVPVATNQAGSLFGLFFTDKNEVVDFKTAKLCNEKHFLTFHKTMLANGIYLAPSMFEAGFVSTAHGAKELDLTLQAFDLALGKIKHKE